MFDQIKSNIVDVFIFKSPMKLIESHSHIDCALKHKGDGVEYIKNIYSPIGDGHCGFRAAAYCRFGSQHEWIFVKFTVYVS